MGPDGSLDCLVGVRLCTDPYGTVLDPDVPSWDPMGPNPDHQTLTPDGVRQRATLNTGARPPPLWLMRLGME